VGLAGGLRRGLPGAAGAPGANGADGAPLPTHWDREGGREGGMDREREGPPGAGVRERARGFGPTVSLPPRAMGDLMFKIAW
jgi:hypothetical protein